MTPDILLLFSFHLVINSYFYFQVQSDLTFRLKILYDTHTNRRGRSSRQQAVTEKARCYTTVQGRSGHRRCCLVVCLHFLLCPTRSFHSRLLKVVLCCLARFPVFCLFLLTPSSLLTSPNFTSPILLNIQSCLLASFLFSSSLLLSILLLHLYSHPYFHPAIILNKSILHSYKFFMSTR